MNLEQFIRKNLKPEGTGSQFKATVLNVLEDRIELALYPMVNEGTMDGAVVDISIEGSTVEVFEEA